MKRRAFLKMATAAGAGMLGHPAIVRAGLPALPCPHPGFLRMFPLTERDDVVDGRPCFSPDGNTVLFMRQFITGRHSNGKAIFGATDFFTIPSRGGEATRLLHVDGMQLTRPDWSWTRSRYEVAFTGIRAGRNSIFLLDLASRKHVGILLGDTAQHRIFSYPSWFPGGGMLCVTNYWENVNADGFSSPNTHQHLLLCELNGRTLPLTRPRVIWPGMSSVAHAGFARGGCPPIAFAGELPNAQGYNQDLNQIWIRRSDGRVFAVDGKQARAPWWSPDGMHLAFESNRLTGRTYQIFIQNPSAPAMLQALTCPEYAVQHAKWSPDGRRLVFAYGVPGSDGAQGIAYVDLDAG